MTSDRDLLDLLGGIPPEALLTGPPDTDVVLDRALRQIRATVALRRRRLFTLAAGILVLAGIGVGGILVGRATVAPAVALPAPRPSAVVPGTRTASAVDPDTQVTMTASVVPVNGWSRVVVTADGLPAGEKCRMVVVDLVGGQEPAGGWIVPASPGGVRWTGSAAVAAADVASVRLVDGTGRVYATVKF